MTKTEELIEAKKMMRSKLDNEIKLLEQVLASEKGILRGAKKLTTLKMAEEVLRNAKKQLHTTEIAREIQEKFDFYVKPSSLGTMLYRAAVEREKVFRKAIDKENTYLLLD